MGVLWLAVTAQLIRRIVPQLGFCTNVLSIFRPLNYAQVQYGVCTQMPEQEWQRMVKLRLQHVSELGEVGKSPDGRRWQTVRLLQMTGH